MERVFGFAKEEKYSSRALVKMSVKLHYLNSSVSFNRCVKKFNSTGHLLTRVPIPEVPSRIALVSHGKAAISVMNKKVLLFLSLLGTVRILSSVKVKKPYCFLATAGQGLIQGQGQEQGQGQGECQLLAATSLCDVIDLISESGVLLRRLFTQKGDKVGITVCLAGRLAS